MVDLSKSGDVFVLKLVDEENRFNPMMLDAINAALDEVEAAEGPSALVLTGEGKFFSNGLDLDWMMANGEEGISKTANGLQALYARLLAFPDFTVAAVNGHAFAGGGMLALACDQRVMRSDRGFFCLPEADINIPFTVGMMRLVQAKLTPQAGTAAMTAAQRFTAEQSLAAGIVDAIASEDEVLPAAIERAQAHAAKDRGTLGTIKQRMYAHALEGLAETVSLMG